MARSTVRRRGYVLRHPREADLPALAQFEVRIAQASFADEAIVDPDVHAKRIRKAMRRDRAGMFVVEDRRNRRVVGWLWVSISQNFTTGKPYAHFRSLAVEPGRHSAKVADLLFERGLQHARDAGVSEAIGRVHVHNVPMRLVYRKFGFDMQHITMRRTLSTADREPPEPASPEVSQTPQPTVSGDRSQPPVTTVKCVVWDLDGTVWPGVAAEMDGLPEPDARVLEVIDELERRGIVSSLASRNDPSLHETLRRHPRLADRFLFPQIGWCPKSGSVRRIAAELNVGLDAVAFVDDDPFERAEVQHLVPEVLVLAPQELEEALEWPAFSPGRPTSEAAARAQRYRDESRRRDALSRFSGSRTDFLRWCDMSLHLAPATELQADRLLELAARAHQLNSNGLHVTAEELRRRLRSDRWLVAAAQLRDRFGDYGTIGMTVIDRAGAENGDWVMDLVVMSCRVEGRGIPAALLAQVMWAARASSVGGLWALHRPTERNLRMTMLLRQLGFRPVRGSDAQPGDGATPLRRDLELALPPPPPWLAIESSLG